MSNHIHCILSGKGGNLSGIIRDMKSHTAKAIYAQIEKGPESRREWLKLVCTYSAGGHNRNEQFQVWEHDSHAEELLSYPFMLTKLNYMHLNPVRAGLVREPQEWLWSSAGDYIARQQIGSVKICFLDVF